MASPDDLEKTVAGDTDAEAIGQSATPVGLEGGERYRILDVVGRGGRGVILRAVDLKLDRVIALKVIHTKDDVSRGRFRDEARITARLEHPSIVPVHDTGVLGGGAEYYSMKLSSGKTLAAAIREAPDLATRLGLVGSVLAVADALAYAHSRGVIHRDLKPDNVLVGEFGETLVIDWGLAKERGERTPDASGDSQAGAGDPDRTMTGSVIGTPTFMAPEQARGEPVDARADVYALGAILYTVLTSRPPRRGVTRDEVLIEAMSREPIPVEEVEPGAPRDLAAIVRRALSLEPAARYPTALELAEDLRRFLTGRLVGARVYTRRQLLARWLRRNRAMVITGSLSAAILIIVAASLLSRVFDARTEAEGRNARLLLQQARSVLDRDPALALAWLKRLLSSPGVGAIDLEEVRWVIADARARGVAHHALEGAADVAELLGTPDGRFAIVRAPAGQVLIWNTEARGPPITLGGPIHDVALAPDGATLATAEETGVAVRRLDGSMVRRWGAAATRVVCFTAGGELVFGGDDATIHAGLADGRLLDLAVGDAIVAATALPEGRVAVGTRSGRLVIWRPGEPSLMVSVEIHKEVRALAAVTGGQVAIATADTVGLWNPSSGQWVSQPSGAQPQGMSVSEDGELVGVTFANRAALFRVGTEGIAKVEERLGQRGVVLGAGMVAWSAPSATTLIDRATSHEITLSAPPISLRSGVAFAGRRVLIADNRSRLLVFDPLPVMPATVWRRPDPIRYARRMPDERIAFFTVAGEIGIADPRSGELTLLGRDAAYFGVGSVNLLATSEVLVVGGQPPRRFDLRTRQVSELGTGALGCAAVAPSGEIAVLTTDGRLKLYDRALTRVVAERPVMPDALECEFLRDGRLAVSHGFDSGAVSVIDLGTGLVVARDQRQGVSVAGLAVLPDDSIVSGDSAGSVQRWRPGNPARRLFHDEGAVFAAAVSPDGRLIATAGRDTTVRISTPEGRVVQVLRGHTEDVSSVAFSFDGTALISASLDGTIRRWPVDRGFSPPETVPALAAHLEALTSILVEESPPEAR